MMEFDTGSRDPYQLDGHGAGFALCWKGAPQLLIGQPNDALELIQVISDSMLIIIPKYVLNRTRSASRISSHVASRIHMVTEQRSRLPKMALRDQLGPSVQSSVPALASVLASSLNELVDLSVIVVLVNLLTASAACSSSNLTMMSNWR